MNNLEEILKSTRKNRNLCHTIEGKDTLCFNKVLSKNICGKHYQRLIRTGRFDLIKKKRKCKFIDCNNEHSAKGYCIVHHKKFIKSSKKCIAVDCLSFVHSKNLCKKHYERQLKYGSVNGKSKYRPKFTQPEKRGRPERIHFICIVPNCGKINEDTVLRKGLCKNHYYKWRRYGNYNYINDLKK